MDKLVQESVELLRKMVATPSVTFDEDSVIGRVREFLSSHGVDNSLYGKNIVALKEACCPGAPTLVLDAHLDTVPPASGYAADPYDSGTDPDVVRGLGSNDDGGSVAAFVATFRHFQGKELRFNLILALGAEEEKSGPQGAAFLYGPEGPFAKGELPEPSHIIIGEPTSMKAATSERGLLVLDGTATGVSGHAARGEGVNAIYVALEDIRNLISHKFAKVSPTMGSVKLSVTQISAGTAHNVIPDKCSFVVDIRPTEQYGNSEILEELQSFCRSALTARNLANKSSATIPGSPLLAALEKTGIGTFSSPTTSNWIKIPYDAIKIGPGDSSRSHKADEYVTVKEIEDGYNKYIQLIEAYGNSLEQRHQG